jgi:uncharacterized membrane protein YfcA
VSTIVLLAASALAVGVMIGCVGVGGVLLPFALLHLAGLDIHLAVSTSMWSFLFTGLAGAAIYHRRGTLELREAGRLLIGVVPAAFLGARANVALPPIVLTLVLAGLVTFTGLNSLLSSRRHGRGPDPRDPSRGRMLVVGAIVGFGSALSGTGGPVLLVPILLLLRVPVLSAVAMSQMVQVFVALSASVGYVVYGGVDFVVGTCVGLVAALGVLGGAHVAHRVSGHRLQQLAAIALIGAGVFVGTSA